MLAHHHGGISNGSEIGRLLGESWEGFCIEQILCRTDDRQAYFWATHSGAELDLLLLRNGRKIGFEFKYSDAPRTTKSMHSAVESLQLEKLLVVHPGEVCYPLTEKIQVLSLPAALQELEG